MTSPRWHRGQGEIRAFHQFLTGPPGRFGEAGTRINPEIGHELWSFWTGKV